MSKFADSEVLWNERQERKQREVDELVKL